MANQSAKKNQQKIKGPVVILTYLIYGITAWFLLWNIYYLLSQQVSIWHFLLVVGVSYLNTFCLKNVIKCWQLQISSAAQYYYDILAMNGLVCVLDFWTHQVWHVYWLILAFVLFYVGKWLWGYITPKYEETEESEEGGKKDGKKEKKEKVKYVKH